MPGLGPVNLRRWVEQAGSLEVALAQARNRFVRAGSIFIERDNSFSDTMKLPGAWALSWEGMHYPAGWREMKDAPPLIFGLGTPFTHIPQRRVGIVGTRNCSPLAVELAFELGKEFARRQWVVVSGLARGVDAAAHRGACYAGHCTVGVLGGPLHPIHPFSSTKIAERMIQCGGTVVSERALRDPIASWHFASRNRLVVGLSEAMVLIQSPAKGGALISAELAIDSGIDCWVYRPETMHSNGRWAGNTKLLEQFPEMGWSDPAELIERLAGTSNPANSCRSESKIPTAFLPVWRQLMIQQGGRLADVARALERPESSLRRQLYAMEMQGYVQRIPGDWYIPMAV